MSKKAPDSFHICWWWEFLNDIHLFFVHFNALEKYFVAQDNPFSHHEMAFLPIENEIGFNTSLEHNFQICQAKIK